ncbi:MAG: hypothetical protein V2I26_05325 [Halieaceae bacterium]|jgi:hypothetical protein|nr:hypothetical protein [Halieaceae bacterium]
MSQPYIPEEKYPSKVSAEFANDTQADRTVKALVDEGGFERKQVTVIKPNDQDLEHKLEPETRAIGAGVAMVHLGWTVAGLLVGLAAAWLLVHLGPPITRSSPLLTYLALVLICPMLGFFLGSVISLRPDHDRLVGKARAATGSQHWTVVVHCADGDQKDRAKRVMDYTAQTL